MDNILAFENRSTSSDFGEIFVRNRRVGVYRTGADPPPERRSTISSMLPSSYQNTRMRNLSGGSSGSTASGSSSGSSTQLDSQLSFLMDFAFNTNTNSGADSSSSVTASHGKSTGSHRKLDLCWNDSNDNDKNGSHRSVNSSRYKTELCRPFEESGSCKYGDKCQFAHGYHELRNLTRHPKYKTELCRTFHTVGFCPYGPRCHFIHEDETKPASPKLGRNVSLRSTSGNSSPSMSPLGSDDVNVFSYRTENTTRTTVSVDNHLDALSVNINYNRNIYDLQALDKHFTDLKLDGISSNNNIQPRQIDSGERDIFSEITMFNSDDALLLDNAPKAPSSSAPSQSIKLDNFSYMDTHPSYWQSSYDNYLSQIMRSVDSSHSSPTGSDCSSGSNHGGSTESLTSNTFSNWRCQVSSGLY